MPRDPDLPIGMNFSRNQDKCIAELLGMLRGLVADRKLSDVEVVALDGWLRDNKTWLRDDPDYIDILDLTTDILTDCEVSREEIADLKGLLYTVIKYRDEPFFSADEATTHLIGLARGITADAVLLDSEVSNLRSWLKRASKYSDAWPVSHISHVVNDIVSDGKITEQERANLYDALVGLVGGNVLDDGTTSGTATSLPVQQVDQLEFEGKTFCFTGKFLYGTRSHCAKVVIDRGAVVSNKVTKKTDYLVIGTVASVDWANSSYGRKVQKAVEYRDAGQKLAILSEEAWCEFLLC